MLSYYYYYYFYFLFFFCLGAIHSFLYVDIGDITNVSLLFTLMVLYVYSPFEWNITSPRLFITTFPAFWVKHFGPRVKKSKRNYLDTGRNELHPHHTTPRNNIGYLNLTSEVTGVHRWSNLWGHWRSKIANWGHTLMKTLRDTIFCIYTLTVSTKISDFKILTSEVICCHWRSKTSK